MNIKEELIKFISDIFAKSSVLKLTSKEFCAKFCNLYTSCNELVHKTVTTILSDLAVSESDELSCVASEREMQWIGYVYAYWNLSTVDSLRDIYIQAPYDVVLSMYPAYSCMKPEDIIKQLKHTYSTRVRGC